MYIAWTDGSYKSSINQGGYSSIILQNDKIVQKIYQGFKNTTNNRMELMGVLETLKFFETPTKLTIYSDSQYVVKSITEGHVNRWFKEEDYSKKNLDIWHQILELLELHTVEFKWVKGHADNKWNELADLYAQHAAECLNLQEDEGFSRKFSKKT